ncbi:MAG: hybrid sensor histidine kinase/response regulator [Spartobacteria bacterium]|nr:hybrid sensor histidine kinase/response regulator [Spartobacteria bacterium]
MNKDHILIVDDEAIVRTGLAELLKQEGYMVTTADSTEAAKEMIPKLELDLVLSDIVMEGEDGMELLRFLRENYPDISVIMMTGYASMDNAVEALRLGARDYIQKPAGPAEIVHRLETILESVRLRKMMAREREEAEQRKRELFDQVVRAERMASLGTLADGMAYELNNILAPVVSYPSLILEHIPVESLARQYVEEIKAAGRRATNVIHDLQLIGRGSKSPNEFANVNEVIRKMVDEELSEREARRLKINVALELQDELPPVACARSQLNRVMANLILNAREALMDGGGELMIATGFEQGIKPDGFFESGPLGNYVVLTVCDTGQPMDMRDRTRVFEPFYSPRVSEGKRKTSGLALTLVYRVVKDHNGYIKVSSSPEQGNSFTLYFPPATLGNLIKQDTQIIEFGSGETILIVDDYEEQRKVAGTLLDTMGYKVLSAASGQEAVRIFEEMRPEEGSHPIDLVVLDMILADDFDGLETFKRIIEINPGQKAIIVSGFAETDRIVAVRKLGAGSYIQKPYTLEELGKAVRKELRS